MFSKSLSALSTITRLCGPRSTVAAAADSTHEARTPGDSAGCPYAAETGVPVVRGISCFHATRGSAMRKIEAGCVLPCGAARCGDRGKHSRCSEQFTILDARLPGGHVHGSP